LPRIPFRWNRNALARRSKALEYATACSPSLVRAPGASPSRRHGGRGDETDQPALSRPRRIKRQCLANQPGEPIATLTAAIKQRDLVKVGAGVTKVLCRRRPCCGVRGAGCEARPRREGLRARPSGQVVAARGDQLEREVRTEAVDSGDVLAEQLEQCRADIEVQRTCRIGNTPTGRRSWGCAAIPIDAELLQHSFDPGFAGRCLLSVSVIAGECRLVAKSDMVAR
jgi:hypothetical protein